MLQVTEKHRVDALHIDARPLHEAANLLAGAQLDAAKSVQQVRDIISAAATQLAATIRNGSTLYYTAAGSSALMAAADAMELGGTFNISAQQIRILMAGGLPGDANMPGDTEDNTSTLKTELADLTPNDTMIAVSASGQTPYTVKAAELARRKGATVIAIANNEKSPLLLLADYAIHLATPPEVLAGSTRMGAGTAQKITLNMLSTLMAIELGHVYDGMMVNVRADNNKLRKRAVDIVARVAAVDEPSAATALDNTGGDVKIAALLAAGAATKNTAESLLKSSGGHLRAALSRLDT